MKHLKRFNENREDIKKELMSSFSASGNLEQYAEDIKADILSLIDNLSDDDVEILNQLSKLQKGEITQKDWVDNNIDVENIMRFSQNFNKELMSIVKKYQRR